MGIELRNGEGLPIALGGAGMSVLDLVSLYTVLGNHGQVRELVTTKRNAGAETNLLPNDTASQLNWILSHNAGMQGRLHGAHNKQAVALKTGTGPAGSDAWAIGTNGKYTCLLYTSPSPRDQRGSRMPSSA